jgi:hypothetical protein
MVSPQVSVMPVCPVCGGIIAGLDVGKKMEN